MHGSLQVWDLSDAKLVAEVLPGDEEGVYAVQLIDDGSDFRVVAAGESWAGVEPFAEIETKEIPRSASFFREWRCAFVDGHVTFVDPTDIIPTAEMSIPPADFEQYNSSVGRRLLFTGGGPGWINAWDVDSGETWPIDVDAEDVEAFGLIREELSTRLICSTRSMSLEVFDADSGEFEAGVRHGHSSDVTAIASLPAHSKVLTAGRDGTIRVWDLPSIDAVSDFPRGSVPNVLGLDVGRLGRTADVLVAGTDEESGEPLLGVCRAHGGGWSLLPGHDVAVRAAAFSTFDESLAASIDAHGVVILWDLQNGTMIHRSEPEEPSEFGFGGCFSNPIFLRDRVLFVTGHTYGTVNIAWLDFTSGRRVESPNQLHGYSVDQVALVGNDRGFYSVSHSFGGDLSVFDLITGKRVLGLSTGEPLQSDTAISAYLLDGEPMLSFLNADRVIEQWQLREASKLGSITTEGLGRVSTMASGREGSHQFHFVGDYSGHVVGVREDGAQVLDLNVEHSVKALVHTDFHRLYVGTGRGIACLRLTQPGI